MPRPQKLKAKQRAFLKAYEVSLSIRKASEVSKVDRGQCARWRKESEDFDEAFLLTEESAIELIEEEARRRAVDGVKRQRFGPRGTPIRDEETGELIYERVYSDKLLLALLKRHRPQEYSDNHNVTANGVLGVAPLGDAIQQIHQDPEYLEFLRQKAIKEAPKVEVVN